MNDVSDTAAGRLDAAISGALSVPLMGSEPSMPSLQALEAVRPPEVEEQVSHSRPGILGFDSTQLLPVEDSRYLQPAEVAAEELGDGPDHLGSLYRLSAALPEAAGHPEIARLLMTAVGEALSVGVISVTIDPPAGPSLTFAQRGGVALEDYSPPRAAIDLVRSERYGILSTSVASDARFDGSVSMMVRQINSVLAVPLGSGSELHGVLYLDSRLPDLPFTETELEFCLAAGRHAGMALSNLGLHEKNRRLLASLIRGLAATIDARDGLTGGHSARVARYSRGVGKLMGLRGDDLDALYFAGLLHDYGKIGVDDRILRKEGPLTPPEFAHIKQHARFTYDLLRRLDFPASLGDLALIAASHHERVDGQGYPRGLAGDEIPLGGQIIAVTDVYDSLTQVRHYRQPMPEDEVLAHLEEGRGTRFRGDVLDAFQKYWERTLSRKKRKKAGS